MKNFSFDKIIKKEVLKTIIWFDLFSHPLSSFEVFKYLRIKTSYQEVLFFLQELSSDGLISKKSGFYFLPDRDNLPEDRIKRFNFFKKKKKRAVFFTKIISIFPFVQGVFVSNVIGDHNLKEGSDIDLLIISSSGKIWTCRFFCALIAKIFGLRPNIKTKKDKICLSFYIDIENIEMEKFLLNDEDLYFIYWILGLEPIFFRKDVLSLFLKGNLWINNFLPNTNFYFDNKNLKHKNKKKSLFSKIAEKFLKNIQLRIMPKKLKDQAGLSSGVTLGSGFIKLFLEDKRSCFIDNFNKNINKHHEFN
jgi:hypothetical protein